MYKKMLFPLLFSIILMLFSSCGGSEISDVQVTETASNITEDNSVVDVYLDTANEYIEAGDFDSAIAVLEKAMITNSDERLNDLLKKAIKMNTENVETQTATEKQSTTTANRKIDYTKLNGEWVATSYDGTFMYVSNDSDILSIEFYSIQARTQRQTGYYFEINTKEISNNEYSSSYECEIYGCSYKIEFIDESSINVSISDCWYVSDFLDWLPPVDGTYSLVKVDESIPSYVAVIMDSGNVRNSASKDNDSNICGQVEKNDIYQVIDFDGYWYKINYNGDDAYISNKIVVSLNDYYDNYDMYVTDSGSADYNDSDIYSSDTNYDTCPNMFDSDYYENNNQYIGKFIVGYSFDVHYKTYFFKHSDDNLMFYWQGNNVVKSTVDEIKIGKRYKFLYDKYNPFCVIHVLDVQGEETFISYLKFINLNDGCIYEYSNNEYTNLGKIEDFIISDVSIYEHLHEKRISYSFFNYSDKVIKYATVYLYFKNDVNDVVSDVVSGSDYYWYVETGPFEPVQEYEFNYSIPIKNNTANFVYVDKVEVEYMDGTKITYAGNSLHVLLDNDGKTPYQ